MRLIALLRLLLALTVALVSAHTAVSRLAMAGAVPVEICTETGVTTLRLDGQGRPMPMHAACPDCVLGGLGDLPPVGPPVLAPLRLQGRMARPLQGLARASRPVPAEVARGPPARV